MTRDELLNKLLISDETKLYETLTIWQKMLYAVVELHTAGNGEASRCEACWVGIIDCPTIEAIEKALA